MGSSGLISEEKSKVESTSLAKLFEEQCPIYMSYGMSYDEFWFGDPYRTQFYRDAHNIKVKQRDEEMWVQGMYIYEALCKVSPILHAFSKKGTKPLPFSDKPYLFDKNLVQTKAEKEKEVENERLIARLHFETWARETKKRFKNKQGGD